MSTAPRSAPPIPPHKQENYTSSPPRPNRLRLRSSIPLPSSREPSSITSDSPSWVGMGKFYYFGLKAETYQQSCQIHDILLHSLFPIRLTTPSPGACGISCPISPWVLGLSVILAVRKMGRWPFPLLAQSSRMDSLRRLIQFGLYFLSLTPFTADSQANES